MSAKRLLRNPDRLQILSGSPRLRLAMTKLIWISRWQTKEIWLFTFYFIADATKSTYNQWSNLWWIGRACWNPNKKLTHWNSSSSQSADDYRQPWDPQTTPNSKEGEWVSRRDRVPLWGWADCDRDWRWSLLYRWTGGDAFCRISYD